MYKVDWTKIKTLEEVIMVLSLLNVTMTEAAVKDNPKLAGYVTKVEEIV